MPLKYLSGILTAITIGLLVLFWKTNSKDTLSPEATLKQSYGYSQLNSAELAELGSDYVSAYENLDFEEYPAEFFGWLSYPPKGSTALYRDEDKIGDFGQANCISGIFISPLGESREKRANKFNGKYVRLIGSWQEVSEFGIYPAQSIPDNPCENMITFIAVDMFLIKQGDEKRRR